MAAGLPCALASATAREMMVCTSETLSDSEPGTLKTLAGMAVVAVVLVTASVLPVVLVVAAAGLGVELLELVLELALPSFLPQALSTRSPLNMMLRNGRIRAIISVSPPRRPIAGSRREIPPGARHWCHAPRRKAC